MFTIAYLTIHLDPAWGGGRGQGGYIHYISIGYLLKVGLQATTRQLGHSVCSFVYLIASTAACSD